MITKAIDALTKADLFKAQIQGSATKLKAEEKQLDDAKAALDAFIKEREQQATEAINRKLKQAEEKEIAWKQREDAVARVSQPSETVVSIDCRGTTVKVPKKYLMQQPDSLLAHTFSGAHDDILIKDTKQAIRIKSNPEAFNLLVDYLVYGERNYTADKLLLL